MREGKGGYVMQCFEALEDPRIDRCKRHQLLEIIAIGAVICCADSWVYLEMFAKSKEEWFRSFPDLPNGIPSHDTFPTIPSGMCSPAWTRTGSRSALLSGASRWPSFCPERWWPSTEGKTVRRPHDTRAGREAIHLVSAWASPELAEGQHPDLGPSEDRGEIQRNHRHTPAAGDDGTGRVHRNH